MVTSAAHVSNFRLCGDWCGGDDVITHTHDVWVKINKKEGSRRPYSRGKIGLKIPCTLLLAITYVFFSIDVIIARRLDHGRLNSVSYECVFGPRGKKIHGGCCRDKNRIRAYTADG